MAQHNSDGPKCGMDFSKLFPDVKLDDPNVFSDKLNGEIIGRTGSSAVNDNTADTVYRKGIALAEKIFLHSEAMDLHSTEIVKSWVKEAQKIVVQKEQALVECVFDVSYRNTTDHIVLNVVNVAVLSMELGAAMGYAQNSLVKLGCAAFMHDIGIRDYKDIVEESRELEFAEKNQVHQHPYEGSAILRSLKDSFVNAIADIIEQEHERHDGSGYPKGLQGDNISEYAQIIGFIDVYEALTHPRPYRKSYSPLSAIKVIIEKGAAFNPVLIKTFLDTIGLYPRGVYVELNTKEVAMVLKQNYRMPSCPVVQVVYNSKGERTEHRRTIDLSKGTRIFIVRSI